MLLLLIEPIILETFRECGPPAPRNICFMFLQRSLSHSFVMVLDASFKPVELYIGRLLPKGGLLGYPEGTSGAPLGPALERSRVMEAVKRP